MCHGSDFTLPSVELNPDSTQILGVSLEMPKNWVEFSLDEVAHLLATLLAAGSAVAAERWTSPDKFYSIAPPSGWDYREDAPGGHRSFAWISPDGKAEIRISATYNLVPTPEEFA